MSNGRGPLGLPSAKAISTAEVLKRNMDGFNQRLMALSKSMSSLELHLDRIEKRLSLVSDEVVSNRTT